MMMGKAGKKPRKKLDSKQFEDVEKSKKKEKDWGFEDIARSKKRGY